MLLHVFFMFHPFLLNHKDVRKDFSISHFLVLFDTEPQTFIRFSAPVCCFNANQCFTA